ncbi:membrane-bound lytic murein transglycosylase D precursor [Candidatus Symbiothrix dinenymphae]|nr:membrane-bound lytic murein transglycosylase D precursor [Candidatus Symbiothrix dinenymphae]
MLCVLTGTLSVFAQERTDSVYVDRLSKLNNVIELPYNEVVRRCIDGYVGRRSDQVERMLGLAEFYFPMIEESLDRNEMPHELKYLAVIESALNPNAQSRVRATGLWQFMLGTGKIYGLEINSLVDERRDPQKATEAACRYLKDMYLLFGDWTLSIASYNCGAGNVRKAIARAGGRTDYWDIYPYLPRETRMYVPLFIAAAYAMNYADMHNIKAIAPSIPLDVDTVMVTKQVHFDQIAAVLNVNKEVIEILNPQYKLGVIPGHTQPRVLKLPSQAVYAYIANEDAVVDFNRDSIFTNRMFAGNFSNSTMNAQKKKYHKVKRGETLASIGKKYGVDVASIRRWNRLSAKTTAINQGKSLVIYTNELPAAPPSYLAKVDYKPSTDAAATPTPTPMPTPTDEETVAVAEAVVVAAADVEAVVDVDADADVDVDEDGEPVLNQEDLAELEAQSTNEVSSQVYVDVKPHKSSPQSPIIYHVKEGDSLYSIAKQYTGVSHKDLMESNQLKTSVLRIGQTLRIPER